MAYPGAAMETRDAGIQTRSQAQSSPDVAVRSIVLTMFFPSALCLFSQDLFLIFPVTKRHR